MHSSRTGRTAAISFSDKHIEAMKARMRIRPADYVLLPAVVFWAIVGARFEPFRSHFWLTLLSAVSSTVAVMGMVILVGWLKRRNRS